MADDFVHLHAHTEYSSLDGMAKLDASVGRAKEYGQPALAITDHGVTNGWVKFWKACKKAEIKPILGVEFYIVDDMDRKGLTDEEKAKYCRDLTGKALRDRMSQVQKKLGLRKRFHCIAIAKNYDGYRNILRLVTESNSRGFYYKPRIDYDLLYKHKEGIIVTSGCMAGKIPQMILASEGKSFYSDMTYDVDAETEGDTYQIDTAWARMKEEFGDDFYGEIQSIDMDEQGVVNAGVCAYASEFNVPVIATNDIHYVGQSDCVSHDVLLAIQSSFGYNVKKIDDPTRWRFTTEELWLKDRAQMVEDLLDFNRPDDLSAKAINDACDNTLEVADKIRFKPWDQFSDPKVTPSVYLPRKYYPHSYNSAQRKTKKYWAACSDFLWDWCLDGWKRKIKGKVPKAKIPEYEARLKYEFDMVKELNFLEYFIIIADLIKWAKSEGIVVGPARGSSSSSLVCYLTDITEIDPIPWRLMFERFISPNRTDNPDVDIDFSAGRDRIKTYLSDKYGAERVALVGSNILFKGKLVLQDVARVYGLTPKDIEEVKKLILVRSGADRRASFTLMDSMEEFPVCQKFAKQNPAVVNAAAELEGQVKAFGVHAGGVLVADKPLWNYCSVRLDSKTGNFVANVDKHDIEDLGLLKIDALGVDELTMIANAVKLIEERHGIKIEPWEIPVDDGETYEEMSLGNTVGIFQLHSKGITRLCQNIRPDCFEDVAAITALHRPGPLHSGAAYSYGPLKREEKPRRNWHPIIQGICDDTYGEILYQEQLMGIVRECAGFSWKQTGDLRKTISKNVGVEYFHDTYLPPWLDGCWNNPKWIEGLEVTDPEKYKEAKKSKKKLRKLSDRRAERTFTSFMNFGSWSMNKCHAVAYGYISYVSMWLKTHYPIEFMCACIETENNEAERRKLINEIKRLGISIFGPDVNKSGSKFRIEEDGIRCGLLDVKGCGGKAVETIIENAPYKSIFDFERKVNRRAVHKGVFKSLICAGAFERFYSNTKMVLENIEELLNDSKKYNGKPPAEVRRSWKKRLNSKNDCFTDEETTRLKESVTTMVQGDALITYYNGFLDSLNVPWKTVEEIGDLAESGEEIRDAVYVRAVVRSIDLKRYSQEVNYVVGGEEDFRYCLLDLDDESDFIMGSCDAEVYIRYEKLLWEWGVGAPVLVKGNLASGRRKIYVSEMASLDELRFRFEGGSGYKDLQHNEKAVLRTISGNPGGIANIIKRAKPILKTHVTCSEAWSKASFTTVGYISRAKVVQTKKDKRDMMFVSLEDATGTIPIMVWPNDTAVDGGWIRKVFETAEAKGHAVKVRLRRMPGNEKFPETKFVIDYRGRPSVLPLTKKNIKALSAV